MNKKILFLILGILVGVGAYYFYLNYYKNVKPADFVVKEATVSGEIKNVDFIKDVGLGVITIKTQDNKDVLLSVTPDTKLLDQDGNTITLDNFENGFLVEATGKLSEDNSLVLNELKITKMPNIVVFSPKSNDEVSESFTVKGMARVFENQFNIRVSVSGQKIYESGVYTNASDVGKYGDFEKEIYLPTQRLQDNSDITLEAFDYSAKDGSEIDKIVIPLKFRTKNILSLYVNPIFQISFSYPSSWKADPSYKLTGSIYTAYKGSDGFFSVNAAGNDGLFLDDMVRNEINKATRPYGSNPSIKNIQIDGQEARIIFPSADQPKELNNQAELVVNYPRALSISGINYSLFVLYADKDHVEKIANTLKFDKMTVKAFFNNNKLDSSISCDKVFPVERAVFKNPGFGKIALEELFKGPTDKEKNDGYFTSINSGVKIQSLYIEDGVVKADFDQTLQEGVGGSCRVTSVRSQIVNTAKQFPGVKDVIISINGRTEDILQP